MPRQGSVPDAATAIRMALSLWTPLFGGEHLAAWQPCHADLVAGVWRVGGALPLHRLGGAPQLHIAQADGQCCGSAMAADPMLGAGVMPRVWGVRCARA